MKTKERRAFLYEQYKFNNEKWEHWSHKHKHIQSLIKSRNQQITVKYHRTVIYRFLQPCGAAQKWKWIEHRLCVRCAMQNDLLQQGPPAPKFKTGLQLKPLSPQSQPQSQQQPQHPLQVYIRCLRFHKTIAACRWSACERASLICGSCVASIFFFVFGFFFMRSVNLWPNFQR